MIDDDRLRQVIIEKASELFFRFGFTNTTTQQIAEELEISKKTIYKYFPSKESLLEEVLEQEHREMEARLQKLVNNSKLDFLEKAKQLSELLVIGDSRFGPQFMKDLQKIKFEKWDCNAQSHRRILIYIENIVRQGIADGRIRGDVNIDLILLIVSSLQGNLSFESLSRIGLSLQQALEGIIDMLNQGILTDEARLKYARPGTVMIQKYF